eukprot:7645742-Lingulodinium_polyedra.AAC.1
MAPARGGGYVLSCARTQSRCAKPLVLLHSNSSKTRTTASASSLRLTASASMYILGMDIGADRARTL